MSRYLVTGAAGFIGFHVSRRLMERGDTVVGLDNLNDYYDVSLKEARLKILKSESGFEFQHLELADRDRVPALIEQQKFDVVIHLAASSRCPLFTRKPCRLHR